ncbi:Veg family protein [Lachnospiraceae bacterium ZAX-1]
MAVQQTDINRVRASVLQQLGSKVLIQLDRGRHRVDVQEGIIKGAYPRVFTILVHDGESDDNPPQLLSFSYTDVLTKDIRMKLC